MDPHRDMPFGGKRRIGDLNEDEEMPPVPAVAQNSPPPDQDMEQINDDQFSEDEGLDQEAHISGDDLEENMERDY